ncbi:MAG: hypothetical protein IJW63_04830 [Lachnospiraceae bacterium]|nr:hypothetical protein [Lachnospiraceae bacterium]
MINEAKDMTCPKCGGTMSLDRAKGIISCAYCGYQMITEKEETLEEIEAKAQSKSYGYHKGKLRAEAEARAYEESKKGSKKKLSGGAIAFIVIACIVLLGVFTNGTQELAKPLVNPFDYIEVSFEGKDGDGEMMLSRIVAEGIDANYIDYDVSKRRNLLEGEMITITADSNQYRLSENSKTYTVQGLDEYLKDLTGIPQEALDLIHVKAESALDLNIDKTKTAGYFQEMKPVKLYLLTDGGRSNVLYDVFEIRFKTGSGEQTYYVLACFEHVIVREGKQVSVDMTSGIYFGGLTQVQGAIWIMAYDSLEEVRASILTNLESDMELKELDL